MSHRLTSWNENSPGCGVRQSAAVMPSPRSRAGGEPEASFRRKERQQATVPRTFCLLWAAGQRGKALQIVVAKPLIPAKRVSVGRICPTLRHKCPNYCQTYCQFFVCFHTYSGFDRYFLTSFLLPCRTFGKGLNFLNPWPAQWPASGWACAPRGFRDWGQQADEKGRSGGFTPPSVVGNPGRMAEVNPPSVVANPGRMAG